MTTAVRYIDVEIESEELEDFVVRGPTLASRLKHSARFVSLLGVVALLITVLCWQGFQAPATRSVGFRGGSATSASSVDGVISEIYNDTNIGLIVYEDLASDWLAIDILMGMRKKLAHMKDGPQTRRGALLVEWIKRRTRRFDSNSDGILNLAEFRKWWPFSGDTKIKQLFKMLDEQGNLDGALSAPELSSVFEHEDGIMSFVLKDRLAIVEDLLTQADGINQEEFSKLIKDKFAVSDIKEFEEVWAIRRGSRCSTSTRQLFYKDAWEQDKEVLMRSIAT